MTAEVLRMEEVGVALARGGRHVPVVEDLSLTIRAGEMLAMVGESGSGKTMAALSIPRLLPKDAVISGQILLGGDALQDVSERAMRSVRGARVGVVFQDPLAALNPSQCIGGQIAEPIRLHCGAGRAAAWRRAEDLLAEVGIDRPGQRARQYPHQLSGGMRQRAMIALALACGPDLLIADEPTTGLDAVLKHQVLDLLVRLRADRGLAVLLVSHDLALVRRHADSVHVLYAGRSVERGTASAVFAHPRHPYTSALLLAGAAPGRAPLPIPGLLPEPEARPAGCRFAPRCGFARPVCTTQPPRVVLLQAEVLCFFPLPLPAAMDSPASPPGAALEALPVLRLDSVTVRHHAARFPSGDSYLAVDQATLALGKGECLAVVGASGSGKTSLGRAVLQMLPYAGRISLGSLELAHLRGAELQAARRRLGVVFQDPASSLNPAMTVFDLVSEGMRLGGERDAAALRRRTLDLLSRLGLPETILPRMPASLSGGQAQRVALARALAANPDVLVLDEPTSSLDVSSQAMLLRLIQTMAEEAGISCLIITHDVAAVAFMVHRFAVMHQGRIVEVAPANVFLRAPSHAQSALLVEAAYGQAVWADHKTRAACSDGK